MMRHLINYAEFIKQVKMMSLVSCVKHEIIPAVTSQNCVSNTAVFLTTLKLLRYFWLRSQGTVPQFPNSLTGNLFSTLDVCFSHI